MTANPIPYSFMKITPDRRFLAHCLAALVSCIILTGKRAQAENPVFPGWYADPEGVIFDNSYWVYPTFSAPYDQQTFLDAGVKPLSLAP
jgi:hypothetical protein